MIARRTSVLLAVLALGAVAALGTAAVAPVERDSPDSGGRDTDEVPGFGLLAAAIGALVAALLAAGRREDRD